MSDNLFAAEDNSSFVLDSLFPNEFDFSSLLDTDFSEGDNSGVNVSLFPDEFDFGGGNDGNTGGSGGSGDGTAGEDGFVNGRTFNGTTGNDTFSAIGDRNIFNGNGGNDTFNVTGSNNLLNGGPGRDSFTVVGDRNTLNGADGDDVLDVVGGVNTLNGGAGDDTLLGTGNNTLNGGPGRDRFLLSPFTVAPFINTGDPGQSVIQDFQDGVDTLVLPVARFFDTNLGQTQRVIRFDELTIQQQSQGAAISFQTRPLALLQGVQANQITAADFSVPNAFETSLISLDGQPM